MRYVSIDIETTGLDPERDQVLEFAAVFEDTEATGHLPIEKLPSFRRLIRHDRIVGHPKALAMNARLIAELAEDKANTECVGIGDLAHEYQLWLLDVAGSGYWPAPKMTPAGKNFGSFDKQFLNRRGFEGLFRHRALDPGSMFPTLIKNGEDTLPSLSDIGKYLGVEWPEHTALGDARAVVYAVRAGLNYGSRMWSSDGKGIQATV